MAISATLQLYDGGMIAANLINIYTVLNIDYTIERSCDKTGRPSGRASISVIKVTIRAAKQKSAPFHDWINGIDTLKSGAIKIYDSAGILSSTIQDATGTDTLLDISDVTDLPNDMMGGAMGEALDQASNYGSHDDIYDEMSHDDLVEKATDEGITVKSGDTDDAIREKIRIKKETDKRYADMMEDYDGLKTVDEIKEFKKKYSEFTWSSACDTSKKTKDQLLEEIKDNKWQMPPIEGLTEDKALKKLREYVAFQTDLEGVKDVVSDKDKEGKEKEEKPRDTIEKSIQEQHSTQELKNKSFNPAYQEADKRKAQTVSTSKQVVKELTRRVGECARTIEFQNAYCISLKEHFDNDPESKGKLDSDYPWTIELGIKPQTVTVKGEQVGALVGAGTEFKLF